jgi:hypothetical protein
LRTQSSGQVRRNQQTIRPSRRKIDGLTVLTEDRRADIDTKNAMRYSQKHGTIRANAENLSSAGTRLLQCGQKWHKHLI